MAVSGFLKLLLFFISVGAFFIWNINQHLETNKDGLTRNIGSTTAGIEVVMNKIENENKIDSLNKMVKTNTTLSTENYLNNPISEKLDLSFQELLTEKDKMISILDSNSRTGLENIEKASLNYSNGPRLSFLMDLIIESHIDPKEKIDFVKRNIRYSNAVDEDYQQNSDRLSRNSTLIRTLQLIAQRDSVDISEISNEIISKEPDSYFSKRLSEQFRIIQINEGSPRGNL